jgi:acetyl esterase
MYNFMRKIFTYFLLIFLAQTSYSQQLDSAKIIGLILNPDNQIFKIGDNSVDISDSGKLVFSTQIENPSFFEVSYGDLYWVIYLEPGKTVKFELQTSDLSSLTYQGDLKVSNDFLKKASLLNTETNDFFNKNWAKIHSLNEAKFISVIDSLKQLFLKPLVSFQDKDKYISSDFVKLFQADINFGFNILIVQYPQKHYEFTHEKVILSQECLNYLNSMSIDDIKLMDLQTYKRYCRAWIDYNIEILADKIIEQKHYDLKKMDVLFEYLPTVFKNQILVDYWLSEYLNELIQNTWLANSKKYIEKFNSTCKTEIYKNKVNELYSSCLNSEKDHIVKVFKSVNGYLLEANIFYPNGLGKGEKKPAMVIFYGGGFVLGNPSWAFGKAKYYADLGMVAIAAQYRLSNFKDITPIDAIQDAKDLMFWLRKNADSLGIMDDRIAASGWSVGAQLCATLAIFPDTLPNSNISSAPDIILLTSPGTDAKGWFTKLLNGANVSPQDYSPIDHVRAGLPPTIILQGRDDTVTPLDGVQSFYDKLIAKGNYCEIWIYDKVGHLFTPTYLGDNGWPRPDKDVQKQADLKTVEFLKKFGYIEK